MHPSLAALAGASLLIVPALSAAQPAAPPSGQAPPGGAPGQVAPVAPPSGQAPPAAPPSGQAPPPGQTPQGETPPGAMPPYPVPPYPWPPYGMPPYAMPPGAMQPYGYPYPPPYYAPFPSGRMKTHSPALMGGGIALVVLGTLSVLGAVTTFVVDAGGRGTGGIASLIIGIPLLIHGAGCVGGGIPMIVIGNRKIPIESPAPGMPIVVPSRNGAALRWTF